MQQAKERIRLSVNGETYELEVDPETPLLYIVRNQLGLNGPKYGCGLGKCGSCMLLIDGQAIMSCTLTVKAAEGKKIVTLAGLTSQSGALHPIQQAFLEEQAGQCGYCTNGMIISAVALLEEKAGAEEEEIRQALMSNLCRCGTHSRVLRAIQRVSTYEK